LDIIDTNLLLPQLSLRLQLFLLPPVANEAAKVSVDEGEGVREERAHLRGPHQEKRHAENGVQNGDDFSPVRFGRDVAIAWEEKEKGKKDFI